MERNDIDDMAEAIFETTRGNWYLTSYKEEEAFRDKYENLIVNYKRKKDKNIFNEEEAKKGIKNLLVDPIAREIQNCTKSGKYGKDYYMSIIPKEARDKAVDLIYEEMMDRIKYMQKNPDSENCNDCKEEKEDKSPRLTIIWDDPEKTNKKVVDIDKIKGKYMYIRPEQDVEDVGEEGYSHLSEIQGSIKQIHEDWEADVYKNKEKTAHVMYLRLKKLGLIVRNNNKGELKDWGNKSKAIDMINKEIALFNDSKSKPLLIKENFIGLNPSEMISSKQRGIEVPADNDLFSLFPLEIQLMIEDLEKNNIQYIKLFDAMSNTKITKTLYFRSESGIEVDIFRTEKIATKQKIVEYGYEFDCNKLQNPKGNDICSFRRDLKNVIRFNKGIKFFEDIELLDDLIEDETQASKEYAKYSIEDFPKTWTYDNIKKIQKMFEDMAHDESKHRVSLKYFKDFLEKIKKNSKEYFDVEEFVLGYFHNLNQFGVQS